MTLARAALAIVLPAVVSATDIAFADGVSTSSTTGETILRATNDTGRQVKAEAVAAVLTVNTTSKSWPAALALGGRRRDNPRSACLDANEAVLEVEVVQDANDSGRGGLDTS